MSELNHCGLLFAGFCVLASSGAFSADKDGLFPFAFSPDAPTGVADLSALVEAPAGRHGFVRCENGRFVTDAGPIRFNGVNLTGAPYEADCARRGGTCDGSRISDALV
ncbi:MAG: hypothetical protein PHV28_05635 [Kiritimatiellae bacterium]|nr:hypothetical protein [Kiritimatiellia bacterium]